METETDCPSFQTGGEIVGGEKPGNAWLLGPPRIESIVGHDQNRNPITVQARHLTQLWVGLFQPLGKK
ncbi:hypothetical protein CGZ80_18805 [Rhodopirellula sp. MGV]|nr:hypothetical protein CGZ80_18805 [Rhodopirellula sp. MGV]PNY35390.1 hypothetical protein C2E31_17910 [Rhodopirellula baltica]